MLGTVRNVRIGILTLPWALAPFSQAIPILPQRLLAEFHTRIIVYEDER